MLAEQHGGHEERPWKGRNQGSRINGASCCEVGSSTHEWAPHDERRELTETASLESKWRIGVAPRKDESRDGEGTEKWLATNDHCEATKDRGQRRQNADGDQQCSARHRARRDWVWRIIGARIAGSVETIVIVAPVVCKVVCRVGEICTKEGSESEEESAHRVAAERGVADLAAPPGEEEALSGAEDRQRQH